MKTKIEKLNEKFKKLISSEGKNFGNLTESVYKNFIKLLKGDLIEAEKKIYTEKSVERYIEEMFSIKNLFIDLLSKYDNIRELILEFYKIKDAIDNNKTNIQLNHRRAFAEIKRILYEKKI
ncbi:MAG: hypothetical protein ACTSXG_00205 [Alphaproteobacteria bacterium]